MAVFRIEKTRDYTVMSNHHLRDMSLSLKAKGLLSLMLSLPENWDYTMKGLARICKDGIDSISGGIRELEAHGYRIRRNGVSNYTVMRNTRIIFLGKIPDHTDDIKSTRDIPSWKRMCFCILKNDHNCRSMGFGLTREQQRMVQSLKQKYGELGEKTWHS